MLFRSVTAATRVLRRLNVAVTRAKRHVAIVCDSETVGSAFVAVAPLGDEAQGGPFSALLLPAARATLKAWFFFDDEHRPDSECRAQTGAVTHVGLLGA